MINHDKKAVYIEIPRAASTSIRIALMGDPAPMAHMTAKEILETWDYRKGDPKEYFWFTFVRIAAHRSKSLEARDGCIKEYHWGSPLTATEKWLYGAPCEVHVFDFYQIDEHWKIVAERLGLGELPHMNKTK